MGLRNLRYENDPILKKKSKEVEIDEIKTTKIQNLIKDMIDTMHKNNGVGLAAVQVGILKNIVVIDLYDDKGIYVLINPKIIQTKGTRICDEGCLSYPNQYAKVKRPEIVVCEYYDENGKKKKIEAKDLLAQAICHETDHLEGIVFVDIMEPGTLVFEKGE